ncbi:unnamed protein product, partial [Allacma fusca]
EADHFYSRFGSQWCEVGLRRRSDWTSKTHPFVRGVSKVSLKSATCTLRLHSAFNTALMNNFLYFAFQLSGQLATLKKSPSLLSDPKGHLS